jgi:hypothetical protein
VSYVIESGIEIPPPLRPPGTQLTPPVAHRPDAGKDGCSAVGAVG